MSTADPTLVRRLQRHVGDLLQKEQLARRQQSKASLTGENELQAGRSFIQTVVDDYRSQLVEAGQSPLSWDDEKALAAAIEARTFGAGRLQHLIDDADIENIDINGCDVVHVTYSDGRKERAAPVAETDQELIEQIQLLAAHAGLSSRPFDLANRHLDLTLPDGSRLAAMQGNCPRPVCSIRRHRYMKLTLEDLIGTGTMTEDVAEFLRAAVKARLNIMVAGATDAGKTTLLRALTSEIGPEERVITIENTLEIGLYKDPVAHPDVVAFEESLPNAEGHGGISMADLLRRTLRMNPSRVIVGEVHGPEVVTMLNAMSQGNNGSLSTIHTRSARDTFNRIGTLAIQAEEALQPEATAQLVASGLDLVVFVKKAFGNEDGSRRAVREILEVNGYDGKQVVSSTLFAQDGRGVAQRCYDVAISQAREEAMLSTGWRPTEQGW